MAEFHIDRDLRHERPVLSRKKIYGEKGKININTRRTTSNFSSLVLFSCNMFWYIVKKNGEKEVLKDRDCVDSRFWYF